MPDIARRLFETLQRMRVELLTATEFFVTCDQPVVTEYGAESGPAEVFFPIGSHRALLFSRGGNNDPKAIRAPLPTRGISSSEARQFNHRTVRSSENFLYAAVNRDGIRNLFDATSKPQRLRQVGVHEILGITK